MTDTRKILIAGCGYVGTALGMRLTRGGDSVWGLRRNVARIPEELRAIEADLRDEKRMNEIRLDADAVVYAAGPVSSSEKAYHDAYVLGVSNLIRTLQNSERPPKRVVFVSSTRVYGQTDGSWVNEDSPADASGFRADMLRQGESLIRESGFNSIVVRFGGIYGPGRHGALDRALAGLAVSFKGQPIYGNRIHHDDCAGILFHLLDMKRTQPLYLGVDSDPASREEVRAWLSHRINRKIPGPELEVNEPEPSNKRCSNRRIIETGYTFAYPSFREGFDSLLSGKAFAGW